MSDVLQRLLRGGRDWLLGEQRASHGLAVMRIGYGAITLIVLALYLPNYSYTFGRGAAWTYPLRTTSAVNDYPWPITAIFSRDDADGVLLVKYVLLMVVALLFTLGWRTRIVAPVFTVMWLGFSTLNPIVTNTGHYQTFRVMLLFLVFADLSQHWSLDSLRRRRSGARRRPTWLPPAWVGRLLNNGAVVLIGYQICIIYVTSALWKLQGTTWEAGTAIYYPLRLEELALFPGLNDLVWKITPVVFVGTWLGVYLQLLFPLMLLHRWTRIVGLVGVTMMHVGIAVLLSLPFFSATMLCADAVFVREQTWRVAADRTRAALRSVRAKVGLVLRPRATEASTPTAGTPTS
jgi:hypothetical protein